MDIFTPLVDPKRLHPNFKGIKNDRFIRDVLNNWVNGFVDRDNKLVIEFQTTFNSAFWEIYLFAVFKELNYEVDFSSSSPDFIIKNPYDLIVEATIANNQQDSPSEWERNIEQLKNIDRDDVLYLATIRLSNALTSKYKKYKESYADLCHVKNKPFIVAIAPFEQPFFHIQRDQAIRRVLYTFDVPTYKDFPNENRREIYEFNYIDNVIKTNGSKVPIGFFTDDGMKEISAVIFSNTATIGKVRALSSDPSLILFETLRYNKEGLKPFHEINFKEDYNETLLDGLHVFHNPFALYPLPESSFNRPEITHHWYSPKGKIVFDNMMDRGLFERTVTKINVPPNKREEFKKALKKRIIENNT